MVYQYLCVTYSTYHTVLTAADATVAVVTGLVTGTTETDDVTGISSSSPNGSYGRWSFSLASSTVIHSICTEVNISKM